MITSKDSKPPTSNFKPLLIDLKAVNLKFKTEMDVKKEERTAKTETEIKKKKMKMKMHEVVEIETAMVALGIVLLIAGAKHALASLVEQWRATVFLLLNLVLLAILLTSVHSNPSKKPMEEDSSSESTSPISISKKSTTNKKLSTTKKRMVVMSSSSSKCTMSPPSPQLVRVDDQNRNGETASPEINAAVDQEQVVEDHDKEDLNARVEAFIVMFRQQLALDAKGRRSSPSFASKSRGSTTIPATNFR